MKIIKEVIELDDVFLYDTDRYNSNNHGNRPSDYHTFIDSCNTCNWVDTYRSDYSIIKIDNVKHLSWLKKAAKISCQTGVFTTLYEEELQELLDDYKEYDHLFDGRKYFCRTENVSFKYGQHKVGPYTDLKMIIESLVSCIHGHKPIYDDSIEIVIYLFPWVEIRTDSEFRVFVHNNNITAISQQNIYKDVFKELENVNEKTDTYIDIIINYFHQSIRNKIKFGHLYKRESIDFTYDFAIINDDQPYFIEPNTFGREYASGSALFHWLKDDKILYQDPVENIYFRYIGHYSCGK